MKLLRDKGDAKQKIERQFPQEWCKKSRIFLSAIFTFYYFLFKLFLINSNTGEKLNNR